MQLDSTSRLVRFAYWGDKPRVIGYRVPGNPKILSYDQAWQWRHGAEENLFIPVDKVYSKIPEQTSLCKFFWRAFFIMPLSSPVILLILGVVAIFVGIRNVFKSVRVPISTPAFVGRSADYLAGKTYNFVDAIVHSTFVQGLQAIKSRMCPIIIFENRENG